jgi:neurotransmitter:Na+ symporter, NSS family
MVERIHWPNKWVFILAAVGSAAGLGNIWRFPFLAYEHGGAAFIVALIIANIVIGIPLLILEISLGQMKQKGAPDAFGAVKRGFRYVGWFGLVMMFIVMAYYMSVMAWSVDYLGSAFNLSWGADTASYFFGDVLNLSDGPGMFGGFSSLAVIGFIISWILIYFSVWKGVKSVSKVVVWTATLPFVILLVLLIRAVTLPGAGNGLSVYLVPVWSSLLDPQLWLAAFSQVFFSLSIAFGMMVAYGSYNKPGTEITKSAIMIAVGNFLVSFMAGFAVFGTLGFMANQQGVPVTEVVAGGPALVFVVLPQALAMIPVFTKLFAVLFFATIVMLAIDSAFSILEGIAVAWRDRFPEYSSKKLTLWLAGVVFILGIPFISGAGLYYLDIVDHFVVNYGLVIMGLTEALIVGWLWKGNELLNFINERSRFKLGTGWKFSIKVLTPVFLITLLVINIINEFKEPYEGYPVWALVFIGALPIILAPLISWILDRATTRRKQIEQ